MDKMQSRATARAFLRSSHAFGSPDQHLPRTSRERVPPPLDKARPRQACAPMGSLHSLAVTVNARQPRRTPHSVDPDRARAACAPMGALRSIGVTVNARKRRRTWDMGDPDRALAARYGAACL